MNPHAVSAGPGDSNGVSSRAIAFYLPQFHPIPENDAWWGKGFTEWRNVVRAAPMFPGHLQPQLPADLGFYDLRLPEVRQQQAELAGQYGVHGFCYYYYWFGGRTLLARPILEVLGSGQPDFPFCICWANENWTRRWDGRDDQVLIAQHHTVETDEAFIHHVLPFLNDPRYIRVDNKPILLVYRVDLLADPRNTAASWRRVAVDTGLSGLHLCAVQSFNVRDPRPFGFDAAVEFPPHGETFSSAGHQVEGLHSAFVGHVRDYDEAISRFLSRPVPDYLLYRGTMVAWDNSARRGLQADLFHNSTPAKYHQWLSKLVEANRLRPPDQRLLFINAWNEWAEGAHLEPDLTHGHAYLQATLTALEQRQAQRQHAPAAIIFPARTQCATVRGESANAEQSGPLVSVVIPSHNHAQFVAEAIHSVAAQTYSNIELIVIDDGSRDRSVQIIEETLSHCSFARALLKVQPNLGAAAAIDRGVLLSNGDFIAILNSDDYYHPKRIATLVSLAGSPDSEKLLFSGVEFSGEFSCANSPSVPASTSGDEWATWYRRAMALMTLCPTAGFGLLCGSITVSTSNFFFTRSLFDQLLGFSNRLHLAHDWDFALRTTVYSEPCFVPEPLVTYRVHASNSSLGLSSRRLSEGLGALGRYLLTNRALQQEGRPGNGLSPTPQHWPHFFEYFSMHVRPWFSVEPLAHHLVSLMSAPWPSDTSAVASVPVQLDMAAMARFRDGLFRLSSLQYESQRHLCSEAAAVWRASAAHVVA